MPDKLPNSVEVTVHCKNCKGVLLKNINIKKMQGNISFNARCPHCQKDAEVAIEVKSTPLAKIN